MWILKGMDETCAWPEEYNEYRTKKAAQSAYKKELAEWLEGKSAEEARTEKLKRDGIEGKIIHFQNGYDYALWIEQF